MVRKKSQVTGPQGFSICACCDVKPVEAVKRKDGRDTVKFGKCNALSVNTILLAYAVRRNVKQRSVFNATSCTYGEYELYL